MGGQEVSAEEAPELHGIVDRLCAMADMKKPRVAIADSDIPNAFATGRSPNNAVVCATNGILRRLEEPELEAVLAHELSHVAHRDVAVMTIASFLGLLAGLITRMAFYAGMFGGFGGDGGGDDEGDNTAGMVIAVIAVSAAVYAALLIGRPSALAAALVKVSGDIARIPTRDLRAAEPSNAFFFTPALAGGFSLSSIFSTHPSLERRLEQLANIESELGPQHEVPRHQLGTQSSGARQTGRALRSALRRRHP